ncbi:hypothetical protein IF1G_07744 [Cordyceps javanica]|uniref:Uncharacterized protein n=1 Tax=Cordyceps javanica TaxID=43265 RepID=A0A545UX10_9HYPO|nr:hypothetical protein IF1G_07744 [Cordyceps javanica]
MASESAASPCPLLASQRREPQPRIMDKKKTGRFGIVAIDSLVLASSRAPEAGSYSIRRRCHRAMVWWSAISHVSSTRPSSASGVACTPHQPSHARLLWATL